MMQQYTAPTECVSFKFVARVTHSVQVVSLFLCLRFSPAADPHHGGRLCPMKQCRRHESCMRRGSVSRRHKPAWSSACRRATPSGPATTAAPCGAATTAAASSGAGYVQRFCLRAPQNSSVVGYLVMRTSSVCVPVRLHAPVCLHLRACVHVCVCAFVSDYAYECVRVCVCVSQ